jgi:hypothetical protein
VSAAISSAQREPRREPELLALVSIPLRPRTSANARLHWRARAKLVADERAKVNARARGVLCPEWTLMGPLAVRLWRVAPRPMDDDNLRGALKAVRDEVAALFEVDDADPSICWLYGQRRGAPKQYLVEIEVALATREQQRQRAYERGELEGDDQ